METGEGPQDAGAQWRIPRRGECLDEATDGRRRVQLLQHAQGASRHRRRGRGGGQHAERGVGRPERNERVDRDVRDHGVGAGGERQQRPGGVHGAQALEPGDGLQLHAGIGVGERLQKERLRHVAELLAPIGQRAQRKLPHAGISRRLDEDGVRAGTGQLFQREDRGHATRERAGAEHALFELRDAIRRRPSPYELVLRVAAVDLVVGRHELDEPRVARGLDVGHLRGLGAGIRQARDVADLLAAVAILPALPARHVEPRGAIEHEVGRPRQSEEHFLPGRERRAARLKRMPIDEVRSPIHGIERVAEWRRQARILDEQHAGP